MMSMSARPRVKPIYPVYRLDHQTLRIGAQRGLTREFRDPKGQLWSLVTIADGQRSLSEVVTEMQRRFPTLTAADVQVGLARLDDAGLLDDARVDDRVEVSLTRFTGTVNHFRHFSQVADDPWQHQRALRDKRVTLLGLGGGGSAILPMLVALGIGSIRAVDYDRVEASNLNRQFLYHEADIGRLKTEVAERVVGNLNSSIDFETLNRRIDSADDVLEVVGDADLVICAIDEPPFLAQRRVNAGCVVAGVTCLYGGSQVTRGRVFSVIPGSSGCFDCLNIYYTKNAADFEKQFFGFNEIDFDPPTIAFPPDILRLGSAIAAEAVRLLTGYLPPASVGKQVEVDFVSGGTEIVTEWVRYPDDCPTCGTGTESDWPIFAMYPGSTWREPTASEERPSDELAS